MGEHGIVDLVRDALSAVLGGLMLMAVGAVLRYFRLVRARLARHGIEIRHTQKETGVQPEFPEYPADKL